MSFSMEGSHPHSPGAGRPQPQPRSRAVPYRVPKQSIQSPLSRDPLPFRSTAGPLPPQTPQLSLPIERSHPHTPGAGSPQPQPRSMADPRNSPAQSRQSCTSSTPFPFRSATGPCPPQMPQISLFTELSHPHSPAGGAPQPHP